MQQQRIERASFKRSRLSELCNFVVDVVKKKKKMLLIGLITFKSDDALRKKMKIGKVKKNKKKKLQRSTQHDLELVSHLLLLLFRYFGVKAYLLITRYLCEPI